MEGIILSFLSNLASEALKADLIEKLVVFAIAWFFIRKTVKGEFASIRAEFKGIRLELANVNSGVSQLKDAMIELERNHSHRIEDVETVVNNLKAKLERLHELTKQSKEE